MQASDAGRPCRVLDAAALWRGTARALTPYAICHLPLVLTRPRSGGGLQVLQMFDKAEQDFKELSEKKRIVENDKDKIHQVRLARVKGV